MCIIMDFADCGNLEFFICRLEAIDKYFTEQQAKSRCKQLANGKLQNHTLYTTGTEPTPKV